MNQTDQRPKLEIKVEAVLQATGEPRTNGKLTTLRAMGPTAKAPSEEMRGSCWIEVKATGRAAQKLQGVNKGDRFWVRGELSGASKYVDKTGVVREGGLQIWASEVELWIVGPVDEPIHDEPIPF
jgi:hypothetical protein